MYTMRFDGLYRKVTGGKHSTSNAGFMCYGWLISKNGVLVAKGHGAFARSQNASSNIAEYLALIEGLEALCDINTKKNEPVLIMGDAKSVIDQMTGESSVHSPATLPLYKRAMRLVKGFHKLDWCWTPREFNRAADQLTRRAMNQVRWDREGYQAAMEAMQSSKAHRRPAQEMQPLIDFRVYQVKGIPAV